MIIWVLLAVTVSHGHGAGLIKEHVAVFGSVDSCQAARTNMQAFDGYGRGASIWFCQKELVKP